MRRILIGLGFWFFTALGASAQVISLPAQVPTCTSPAIPVVSGGTLVCSSYAAPGTNSDITGITGVVAASWTPTVTFGGGSTGVTYSTQQGSYVRVGKLIMCSFNISLSSKGSSTGIAAIGGLPFTSTSANVQGSVVVGGYGGLATSPNFITGIVNPSVTAASLNKSTAATSMSNMADTDFSATTQLLGTITYLSN